MKISFGGEANWDIHVKSAAHVRSGQAASQKASASRFFSNFITKAPSLPTATSSRSTNLSSTVSLDLSEVDYPEAMDAPILSPTIIDLVDDDRAETPALLDEPASLLMRLRSASKAIPTPHDMNTDQLQIVNHLDNLESSWLLVSPPPLTADDGEIMSEGNIPSIADTPTQPRSSRRRREQVPHAESNTLSCADCDTMFENDTELMTCDGPGCDQVVCACNFNLCISTTHASAISFTLHVEAYSRNPLEVGSVIVYAGKVQDFGL